jgi:hypothetical protein
MADRGREKADGVLDQCRHGRAPSQFCPVCDRAEVGFEPGSEWPEAIDLRERPEVDVRETSQKRRPPGG